MRPEAYPTVVELLISQGIPANTAASLIGVYDKIAQTILEQFYDRKGNGATPLLVAISGAQGTGKSTLASVLPELINERGEIVAGAFSLDDMYRTKAERQQLAQAIHPLLATRGVPGTHDLDLAAKTIDALREGNGLIPRFDKSQDDRCHPGRWSKIDHPASIVIVEGWCMACPPQPESELELPFNSLEADEDRDGRWRSYVNSCLEDEYATFFARFDLVIWLQAPDLKASKRWRKQQENELQQAQPEATAIVCDSKFDRFIQHFERLTQHMQTIMPGRTDIRIELDVLHRPCKLDWSGRHRLPSYRGRSFFANEHK